MFKVFLIVWSIIAFLLICFEFYAEQEVRRAIGTDKEKISNYKRCGLWNIIIFIFCVIGVVVFIIADASSYVVAIAIISGQAIRAALAAIIYYKKKFLTDN